MKTHYYVTAACLLAIANAACSGSPAKPTRLADADRMTPKQMDAMVEDEQLAPWRTVAELETPAAELMVQPAPGKAWSTAPASGELSVIYGLKTTFSGAVIRFGHASDPAAKVWLDRDTHLAVAQDRADTLHLILMTGRARFSRFTPDLAVMHGETEAEWDDVVLSRERADLPVRVSPVAVNPEMADWSLALETTAVPQGIGTLEARTPDGEIMALRLTRVNVTATRFGDSVENSVEQIFHNDADEDLEGTYRFYLPDGASVTNLAMEIDGKLMQGELVEREKARQTYESIVASMRDPALLEWQQGQAFKLRIFPIEARGDKRIVISFVTPLRRTAEGYTYTYPTAGAEMQQTIDHLTLSLDGQTVVDQDRFPVGRDITHRLDHAAPRFGGTLYTERHGAYRYAALRIRPELSSRKKIAKGASPNLVLWIDTSRSALEEGPLTRETLTALLEPLPPTARLAVIGCDVTCRALSNPWRTRGDISTDAVLTFADLDNADGASDFENGFNTIRALLEAPGAPDPSDTEVLYIGDGVPTWGETAPAALLAHGEASLKTARFSAVIIGKGADSTLVATLAGRLGGRVDTPSNPLEVARFALYLKESYGLSRIRNATVLIPDAVDQFPKGAVTLFGDQTLTALFKLPETATVPTAVTLTGTVDGNPFEQRIDLEAPTQTRHVAHRFAAAQIQAWQMTGRDKTDIIETSLDFGVMSKYTSFLVLESEEAYRRHGIERRNRLAQDDPTVSGRNLESLDDRDASLHPNHIQPGDPEIRIPAPQNARAVTVLFPFGETKRAVYDPDIDAWTVRFLIDKDTPEGRYQVKVRITHENGEVTLMSLYYTVDTHAPKVTLDIVRDASDPRRYRFSAVQIIEAAALRATEARFDTDGEEKALQAELVPDIRRVEITLENGRVFPLIRDPETGDFHRVIRSSQLADMARLKVSTFDKALNSGSFELPVTFTKGAF